MKNNLDLIISFSLILITLVLLTIFRNDLFAIKIKDNDDAYDKGFGQYIVTFQSKCDATCNKIGKRTIIYDCIPHPTTGYGCLNEKGFQSFDRRVDKINCKGDCESSKFITNFDKNIIPVDSINGLDIKNLFEGLNCNPSSSNILGYETKTLKCISVDEGGINNCIYTCGTESTITSQLSENNIKNYPYYETYNIENDTFDKKYYCLDKNGNDLLRPLTATFDRYDFIKDANIVQSYKYFEINNNNFSLDVNLTKYCGTMKNIGNASDNDPLYQVDLPNYYIENVEIILNYYSIDTPITDIINGNPRSTYVLKTQVAQYDLYNLNERHSNASAIPFRYNYNNQYYIVMFQPTDDIDYNACYFYNETLENFNYHRDGKISFFKDFYYAEGSNLSLLNNIQKKYEKKTYKVDNIINVISSYVDNGVEVKIPEPIIITMNLTGRKYNFLNPSLKSISWDMRLYYSNKLGDITDKYRFNNITLGWGNYNDFIKFDNLERLSFPIFDLSPDNESIFSEHGVIGKFVNNENIVFNGEFGTSFNSPSFYLVQNDRFNIIGSCTNVFNNFKSSDINTRINNQVIDIKKCTINTCIDYQYISNIPTTETEENINNLLEFDVINQNQKDVTEENFIWPIKCYSKDNLIYNRELFLSPLRKLTNGTLKPACYDFRNQPLNYGTLITLSEGEELIFYKENNNFLENKPKCGLWAKNTTSDIQDNIPLQDFKNATPFNLQFPIFNNICDINNNSDYYTMKDFFLEGASKSKLHCVKNYDKETHKMNIYNPNQKYFKGDKVFVQFKNDIETNEYIALKDIPLNNPPKPTNFFTDWEPVQCIEENKCKFVSYEYILTNNLLDKRNNDIVYTFSNSFALRRTYYQIRNIYSFLTNFNALKDLSSAFFIEIDPINLSNENIFLPLTIKSLRGYNNETTNKKNNIIFYTESKISTIEFYIINNYKYQLINYNIYMLDNINRNINTNNYIYIINNKEYYYTRNMSLVNNEVVFDIFPFTLYILNGYKNKTLTYNVINSVFILFPIELLNYITNKHPNDIIYNTFVKNTTSTNNNQITIIYNFHKMILTFNNFELIKCEENVISIQIIIKNTISDDRDSLLNSVYSSYPDAVYNDYNKISSLFIEQFQYNNIPLIYNVITEEDIDYLAQNRIRWFIYNHKLYYIVDFNYLEQIKNEFKLNVFSRVFSRLVETFGYLIMKYQNKEILYYVGHINMLVSFYFMKFNSLLHSEFNFLDELPSNRTKIKKNLFLVDTRNVQLNSSITQYYKTDDIFTDRATNKPIISERKNNLSENEFHLKLNYDNYEKCVYFPLSTDERTHIIDKLNYGNLRLFLDKFCAIYYTDSYESYYLSLRHVPVVELDNYNNIIDFQDFENISIANPQNQFLYFIEEKSAEYYGKDNIKYFEIQYDFIPSLTVSLTNNTIDFSNSIYKDTLYYGKRLRYNSNSTTSIGLSVNTDYYIVSLENYKIKLAVTRGGAVVNLSNNVSESTQYLIFYDFNNCDEEDKNSIKNTKKLWTSNSLLLYFIPQNSIENDVIEVRILAVFGKTYKGFLRHNTNYKNNDKNIIYFASTTFDIDDDNKNKNYNIIDYKLNNLNNLVNNTDTDIFYITVDSEYINNRKKINIYADKEKTTFLKIGSNEGFKDTQNLYLEEIYYLEDFLNNTQKTKIITENRESRRFSASCSLFFDNTEIINDYVFDTEFTNYENNLSNTIFYNNISKKGGTLTLSGTTDIELLTTRYIDKLPSNNYDTILIENMPLLELHSIPYNITHLILKGNENIYINLNKLYSSNIQLITLDNCRNQTLTINNIYKFNLRILNINDYDFSLLPTDLGNIYIENNTDYAFTINYPSYLYYPFLYNIDLPIQNMIKDRKSTQTYYPLKMSENNLYNNYIKNKVVFYDGIFDYRRIKYILDNVNEIFFTYFCYEPNIFDLYEYTSLHIISLMYLDLRTLPTTIEYITYDSAESLKNLTTNIAKHITQIRFSNISLNNVIANSKFFDELYFASNITNVIIYKSCYDFSSYLPSFVTISII